MRSGARSSRVAWCLAIAIGSGAACTDRPELDDSPAPMARERGTADVQPPAVRAPDGYLFAVNGTHVEACVGTRCPTMWADSPSPNNCGGGFEPTQSYIVHQRGADWDGIVGEPELREHEYQLTERMTSYPAPGIAPAGTIRSMHDQSVIIQCCPAVGDLRPLRSGAFISMKVCSDPCDAPDGLCPITLGTQTSFVAFGGCRTIARWSIDTDRCDLQVVDADWNDPHAPVSAAPGANDKHVFNVYYRAAWTCGDGFCDVDEAGSCASDCGGP